MSSKMFSRKLFYRQQGNLCLPALLCGALLQGCAALPADDAGVPPGAADYESAQTFAAPAGLWPEEAWWRGYGDTQLDGLIDEALAGAPSLAVAEARLARARAYQDVTRGARAPQVTAGSQITQEKQSYNYLSPPGFTPQGWNDYGRAALDFSWELDFFGRNRAALAAATSDAAAVQADLAQARLTLAAAIAAAYAELVRLWAQLDNARAALAVRTTTAALLEQRFQQGVETLGGLRQAESRRASAQLELAALEEQVALQRNLIAALAGSGPDRGLSLQRPQLRPVQSFALPPQLAADLLGRRPDLVAARERAAAAASRVGQARAAFYPNINLNAFIGLQSFGLDRLTDDGSTFGSAGPAVSLPLFDGGRLRGQLRGARAEYAEAVADYENTLVRALRDVADAAVGLRALESQITAGDVAVVAASDAWHLQNQRYQGGLASLLEVLSAEDYLLSARRTQTDLAARSLALDIGLKRALGGGYASTTFSL